MQSSQVACSTVHAFLLNLWLNVRRRCQWARIQDRLQLHGENRIVLMTTITLAPVLDPALTREDCVEEGNSAIKRYDE